MSYYGRMDGQKPKKGVEFMLFEEAMERSLQEKITKLEQSFEALHKKYSSELLKLTEATKKLHSRYEWVVKMFEKDEIKEKAADYKKFKKTSAAEVDKE